MPKKTKLPKEVMDFFIKEGRKGGLKGGPARAEALTKSRRAEIAKKAGEARWKKEKQRKK